MASILPDTCCLNVAHERGSQVFVPCGARATKWYLHDQDICSYCDQHDYPCGYPLTPLKEETQDMSNISNTVHYLFMPTKDNIFVRISRLGDLQHSTRLKIYRVAGLLARELRRALPASSVAMVRVVSVDLTTGTRVERTVDNFLKYVIERRAQSKSRTKMLAKPVKTLFDNIGNTCALGDEIIIASYMGRPYRGRITGFTPYNVQIFVKDGNYKYNKYVSYDRFSKAVLKLT